MDINTLEEKLGIANLSDAEKLALVKGIESNVQASKAAVKAQEAGQYASLVVDAIKRIKNDLETRFNELNGIIDVKAKSLQDGKDGIDGKNGKDGRDGKDGKDGISITGPKGDAGADGVDGVGVQDAYIDFDGSLIIKLTDGKELNVGEVVPMDVAEKIKIIGNGGGTSQSVLDSLTSLQNQINTLTGIDGTLGTMAQQDANAVAITGGTINGTTVGATTAAAGTFTTLIGGGGSANYFQVEGAATTKAVEAKALGSDTNIAFVIDSKGTGAIDLAAGSSGVNISNGGTVTAITRTAAGSGYTSLPNIVISAPTTAGGVQATASVTMFVGTATVSAGGSGYTVGDVLTASGGTFSQAVILTVATLSGSAVATVTITNAGQYTALPSNPVSVTGGTGTGATFTLGWGVNTIAIGTAGSGYVEQPTVTFSSGSAAAYATVGSTPKIQSLGTNLSFFTPGGEQFRVADTTSAGTAVNFIQTSGNLTGAAPRFVAVGADTNVGIVFSSKGTSDLSFRTNGTNQVQMTVSHTASAVNYVQVTGAATGGTSSITFTGSDANVIGAINTKGTGSFSFYSGSGAGRQVRIDGANTTAVNYLDFYGASAASAPSVRVGGSDTNIDLTLTPKGTGMVRFGTFTANADTAVTGYITIKDSGGTVRKLAVIA